jgi:hypothetical protein
MKKFAAAVDRVTQADRRYFERFPHRQHRLRLASQAEIEQTKVIGQDMWLPSDRQHYVVIRNVAPGMRLRHSIVGPRDAETDVSEAEARALYEIVETEESRLIEAEMLRGLCS